MNYRNFPIYATRSGLRVLIGWHIPRALVPKVDQERYEETWRRVLAASKKKG